MANGSKRLPTHRAYVVTERKGSDKASWKEIGAAWSHEDGQGFNIVLQALPVSGEIVLRVPSEPTETE